MKNYKMLLAVLPILLLAQSCGFAPFGGGAVTGGVIKSRDKAQSWQDKSRINDTSTIKGQSVARIRMDYDNRDVLYAGSPTGGVYQSTDAAESWQKILNGVRVFDLQINPKDSSEIFAGGQQGNKAKLFKTSDMGQSWLEVYSEAREGNFVSAIAYDPTNSKNLYIGLSTGEIIFSQNGGVSWDLSSRLKGRILKLSIDSANTRNLLALSMEDGLHRSTDSALTWARLTGGADGQPYQNFIALRSSQVIYVADGNGLQKSPDAGQTWQKTDLPKNESSKLVSAFTVSPKDANEIYATVERTLYKSIDGGATWQTRALDTAGTVRDFVVNPEETNIIYAALGEKLQ